MAIGTGFDCSARKNVAVRNATGLRPEVCA